jgi:hypothetical protein
VTVKITWRQALAWRMQRQLLDPIGRMPVEAVVRRLCGVQAQVASSAELAVAVRCEGGKPREVERALADGRLIKTWAMRGALHLVTPEGGPAFLSLMAAGRAWERPSWQRYFGMTTGHWDELRATVREALDGGPLTREQLAAAVGGRPLLAHVEEPLRGGWGTLLKPLGWQGDLCFAAVGGNRGTFTRPELACSAWHGIPEPDEAAPLAVRAYVGAYGPTTAETFANWLVAGWSPKRPLKRWFAEARHDLAEVEVDGERLFVLAEELDALASTPPSDAVRLLPGFDQYVLGHTTEDRHVLPAPRRAAVSRQSGWISPVVVAGGVISGTWQLDGRVVQIAWFSEAGSIPVQAVDEEVARLGSILGRDLRLEVHADHTGGSLRG